jgi:lipopolysaccharide/colanic/teichoic acid biosynthesis glycosyltransferase
MDRQKIGDLITVSVLRGMTDSPEIISQLQIKYQDSVNKFYYLSPTGTECAPTEGVISRLKKLNSMLKRSHQSKSPPLWKRGFDLLGSCVGLVLCAPLMTLICVYIKATSSGPVLFRHKRYGYQGQPLYVWKFRSMHVDANPDVHQRHVLNMVQDNRQMQKLHTEAELIPLGKWLRSSGLDELPQLFNVFQGEMSLVGPRPDVVPMDQYQPAEQLRFEVLPGLTGLWQVSGKNHTTFREMVDLDSRYVENQSLWLDLKIIFWTVPAIGRHVAEEFQSKRSSNA